MPGTIVVAAIPDLHGGDVLKRAAVDACFASPEDISVRLIAERDTTVFWVILNGPDSRRFPKRVEFLQGYIEYAEAVRRIRSAIED